MDSYTLSYLLGSRTPQPGMADSAGYQAQLKDTIGAILEMEKLRVEWVKDARVGYDDNRKAMYTATTEMAKAIADGMKAVAMGQQAKADAARQLNHLLEVSADRMLHVADTATVADVSTNTLLPMRNTIQNTLRQNPDLVRTIEAKHGKFFTTDAAGNRVMNETAVRALGEQVMLATGDAAYFNMTKGLASLDPGKRADTAVELANAAKSTISDALNAALSDPSTGFQPGDAKSMASVIGNEYDRKLATFVGQDQWDAATTLSQRGEQAVQDYQRWVDSLGVGFPPAMKEQLAQVGKLYSETMGTDPATRMASYEAMKPTHIDSVLDSLRDDKAGLETAIREEAELPADPLLRADTRMRREVPRFDVLSAAMRFRGPEGAVRYYAQHPLELREWAQAVRQNPRLGESPEVARAWLQEQRAKSSFGYDITPTDRFFKLARTPSLAAQAKAMPALQETAELEAPPAETRTAAAPKGLLETGNIDLTNRPRVKMPDGSTATVYSMTVGFDDGTYVLPRVSDDGRIMSEDEAIAAFKKTGKHLGKFADLEDAEAYSQQLHLDQAAMLEQSGTPTEADAEAAPNLQGTATVEPAAPAAPTLQGARGRAYTVDEATGDFIVAASPAHPDLVGHRISKAEDPAGWALAQSETSGQPIDKEALKAAAPARVEATEDAPAQQEDEAAPAPASASGGAPAPKSPPASAERDNSAERTAALAQLHREQTAQQTEKVKSLTKTDSDRSADLNKQLSGMVGAEPSVWDTVPPASAGSGSGGEETEEDGLPKLKTDAQSRATSGTSAPPMTYAQRAGVDPLGLRLAAMARQG